MKKDLLSPKLFGNEAGEDEDIEVLSSYFVEKPDFSEFYSPENKFMIVRSRKGVGKSALLKHTLSVASRNTERITLYIKGSDLLALQEIVPGNPLHLIYGWQQRICSRITLEIGRRLKIAFDDDSITLVESAELAGFRGRNLVGSLVDRLKLKYDKIDVQLSKILSTDSQALLKRYSTNNEIDVWLMIDDIDATFLNNDEQSLLLSTFFSACRNIVNDVKGLVIRSSVRTDVWPLLGRDEALDKCEQYMIDLFWSTKETGQILKKKVLSYFQRTYPTNKKYAALDIEKNEKAIFDLVFKTPFRWGDNYIGPDKPVHILSAGRPRWATQLCKLAAKNAVSAGFSKIGINNVSKVMDIYGKSRLGDIYKEHSHQCSTLVNIIESFSGGPKKYRTQDLLKHITQRIIRRCGLPKIDGIEQGSDSLYIANFLFRIGFIHGRDEKAKTGLSFVKHDDRPHLLTSTANLDDGLTWEIHPSYRTVLKINQ